MNSRDDVLAPVRTDIPRDEHDPARRGVAAVDRGSALQAAFLVSEELMTDTSEPSAPAEPVIRCVGVVGLGHMGHAFAVNLVEDGHQVFVYDRDPKRTAALSGARAAAQLADLAACDAVVTSLR
jgi:NAD binding domain of 6-phosphogluconate dehydrogenase